MSSITRFLIGYVNRTNPLIDNKYLTHMYCMSHYLYNVLMDWKLRDV